MNLPIESARARREDLGRVVRARRQSHGWTAKDAAARLGISHNTLLRVERGEPVRAGSLAAIDELLDLAPGTTGRYLHDPSVGGDAITPTATVDEPPTLGELADRIRGLDGDELRRLRDMIDGALAIMGGGDDGER